MKPTCLFSGCQSVKQARKERERESPLTNEYPVCMCVMSSGRRRRREGEKKLEIFFPFLPSSHSHERRRCSSSIRRNHSRPTAWRMFRKRKERIKMTQCVSTSQWKREGEQKNLCPTGSCHQALLPSKLLLFHNSSSSKKLTQECEE